MPSIEVPLISPIADFNAIAAAVLVILAARMLNARG
jgi:hypothetical protein